MEALEGVRALELCQGLAGAYGGKLLADLGAEVIKVEEPGGDPTRRRGPFPEGIPHPEKSGLFLYLNTNKLGIALPWKSQTGAKTLLELAGQADILLEDTCPGTLEALGLGYEALKAQNPSLILLSVTPFGQKGPYRNFKAYPLNSYHSAGGYLLPGGRDSLGQPPVKAGRFFGEFSCGIGAALAALAALWHQRLSGRGQRVDLSQQRWLMFLHSWYLIRYPNDGIRESRATQHYPLGGNLPCHDGYLCLLLPRDREWPRLVAALGNPPWAEAETFRETSSRAEHGQEINQHLISWLKDQPRQKACQFLQSQGVAAGPVNTAQDALDSPQLRDRGFFVQMEHPVAGPVTVPSAPYHLSRTPWRLRRPAPRLGEHNSLVLGRLGRGPRGGVKASTPGHQATTQALAGVRVLDFTRDVAGSLGPCILALLGAEVIKVESRQNPDVVRYVARSLGWKQDKAWEGLDSSAEFNQTNLNKLGITLDLTKERAREIVRSLVAISDVVVENFRPGVMARFGLDYPSLKELRPDLVMLSVSGFGAKGPECHYLGYAPIFSAIGGLSCLTGYDTGPPAPVRLPSDAIAAGCSTFALLAALIHRQETGAGQHIDFSAVENVACLVGDAIVEYVLTGLVPSRCGNRDEAMAPHNCYPCQGEDQWVSVAIATEEEWQAFCQTTGHPEWAEDPRFSSAAGRRQHEQELDCLIAAWSHHYTSREVMEKLQAIGVAAVPSFTPDQLYQDPHLAEQGAYQEMAHPFLGRTTVIAPPWDFSLSPARIHRPAPRMGEHNPWVLGELLGLTAEEIDKLAGEGVLN